MDVSSFLPALTSHPLAVAAVIFACLIVTRIIGRIAFFAFLVSLIVVIGGFINWID